MDETSQTIAFVCFTIMSSVLYLPKIKIIINEKTQIKYQTMKIMKFDMFQLAVIENPRL